ncbi:MULTISPECIES: TatD family hydrolase [Pseudoalteromonas]|uniref:Hydrolase n=1 Tax=Pseudoalteromonas amylolytica TaxID=1859457 RepID=A0A1S1MPK5_9GAMM|nr:MULTISPECIES: TatD family hydrolase [Pseudoalteromonas]MCF6435387.1 TatD family hydrolase [Pseudoalteromonas sp. MMG022]OHU88518.1 hydrolase [Pseudoalteromonas sp. JW3]OHU90361.1 hydrolase [Pseudoalteromonas amylolytica]
MHFIDTHCHLDFTEFKLDLEQQLAHAHALGVDYFVVPGITIKQSESLLAFSERYSQCRVAAGLHPYFIDQHTDEALHQLILFAQNNKHHLVAIGECGIDGTCPQLPWQQALFAEQIKLSNMLQLPLIVHHRQSHHLIAQTFKQTPPKFGGVIHAFSGSLQQAQYYIKQGFKLGVGGTISYERASKTRKVFSQVPLECLLLETDAPSMPLSGHQGKVNEPRRLLDVFEYLCQLRSEHPEQIARQLYLSSCTLFRI